MANTSALFLKANGEDVEGDSTITSDDREDSIEVLSLEQPLRRAFDRASARASARRFFEPIRFTKRIDRATPRLRQALAQNQVVSGEFRLYRPNPNGDGSTQHFFTLEFREGMISGAVLQLPDVLGDATSGLPETEEIELVANVLIWRYEPDGVEFEDTWQAVV